ncbi:uncharacterized protein LOC141909055 [Tubulanus polymorphus]|uniref:uncharacterized protein LOC141909055 n=1 Tax=Tubulanus polymorphus TaxID=672921 RepID=UPI003DA648FE
MEMQTELSLERIEKLNAFEARNLCRAKSVPNYKQATDLEGLKRCLRIYYYKNNYTQLHERREPAEVFTDLARNYERSCNELKSSLENLKDLMIDVQSQDDRLYVEMEEIVPNFMSLIDEHIAKLEKTNFRILIAGELVAGKTMLLNSLLGEVMLPSNFESNTFTICEITKSQTDERYAEVFPWPGEGDKVLLSDGPDFTEDLAEYIQRKGENSDRGRYARVVIYLNNDFLEDGITIVDSPGIGDVPGLTNMVIDELVNASAFLYVVNVTNRLGVQEDRLVSLLHKVTELKSLDDRRMFLPQSAIFVCNQWDLVKLADREMVLSKVRKKLAKVWTGLQDEQVIPFSALEAELAENAYPKELGGCMTPEFIALLDGIKRLIPNGLENKLTYSYCWIQSFVKRLFRQISGNMNKCHKSAEDNKRLLEDSRASIKKLSEYSEKQMKSLRKYVEDEVKMISKDLKAFLLKDEVVEDICTSCCNDGMNSQIQGVDTFQKTLKQIFAKELKRHINDWESKEKRFARVCPEVVERYNKMYGDILLKLDRISTVLETHAVDTTSADPSKSVRPQTQRVSRAIIDMVDSSVKTTARKVAVGLTVPIWAPAALILGLPGLMYYGILYIQEQVQAMNFEIMLVRYQENPKEFISKVMKMSLKDFCKNALKDHVQDILKPAVEMVTDLEDVIPELIEADKRQIDILLKGTGKEGDLALYPGLKNSIVTIRNRLYHFELFSLMSTCSSQRTNSIHKYFNSDVVMSERKVMKNLLADICDGSIRGADRVSIRSYKKPISPEDMNCYLDEEMTYAHGYQCNSRLVKFYGIVQVDNDSMHFILDPILYALREYNMISLIPTIDDVTSKICEINSIIRQIVEGLRYLHDKKMTHFDLSLDTVAVVEDNMIKLVNFSSNHRKLPDISKDDPTPYRYIAPEVLRIGEYHAAADMYAIGLMMWEMWTGDRAYDAELTSPKSPKTVNDFLKYVETNRPDLQSIAADRSNESVVREWKRLMLDSWKSQPEKRVTANKWLEDYLNFSPK